MVTNRASRSDSHGMAAVAAAFRYVTIMGRALIYRITSAEGADLLPTAREARGPEDLLWCSSRQERFCCWR